MPHLYDFIIIGGGPAGYTAALYAARAGLDTILLEQTGAGGQMALTGTIDNYPGFWEGIDGFTLGQNMRQGAERFGAKTVYARAETVDFSGKIKKIRTRQEWLCGKTAAICTGAVPRELGLPGESALAGRGVHYCAHCDGRFYRGKTVLVAGGGNSAASDALYLSRLAGQVFLIHRREVLRASKIYRQALGEAENIRFIWNSAVSGFLTQTDQAGVSLSGAAVRDLVTGRVTKLSCDAVFVSIGRTPATRFLDGQVALDEAGYINAGESTKTDIPGVYAAGDVRTKPLRQIVTAVSDGAAAAYEAERYLTENGL